MKKILVIAAHPDDEVLGVGGTVRKHVKNGDKVYCLIAAEGIGSRYEENRADENELKSLQNQSKSVARILGYKEVFFLNYPDNRMDSIDLLDIVKDFEKIIIKIKPDIVYTHHRNDLNIDHQICFKAVLTATRPVGKYRVESLFTFETLSSTEWQYDYPFTPNQFVDISNEIDDKIKALKKYRGELRKYPHPRSTEGVRILANYRGLQSGLRFAEAFCLIKDIKE